MSTTLMSLETSTPGVTNDLTAATNIEANWQILDVHDHSSGKGSQVPTSGLNINAALNFSGNKAYNFLATQFSNQSSSLATAANKPCIYVLNGELRYIDNSGNDVLMTNSGSVAGTSGSISGLTAPVAAGFSSATFAWQANSGTGLYAKMSNADINLYQATAGVTNAVTLKSYPSLAASYSVIFPSAVPASTAYVSMDNTGQLATASADTIGAAMTATGGNAVAAIRSRATGTTVAAGGVAISASSGSYALAAPAAYTDVTNLSVTITTSGRPVFVGCISAATSSVVGSATGYFVIQNTGSGTVCITITRGGTVIMNTQQSQNYSNTQSYLPASAISFVDAVAAGTYTYKIQVGSNNGTTIGVQDVKLVAYEL